MSSPAGTATVYLPLALREFAGGQETIAVVGETVGRVLNELARQHPLVAARILGPDGELRRYVNVFQGESNVRDLQGLDTPVATGDSLFIIPAVAGG